MGFLNEWAGILSAVLALFVFLGIDGKALLQSIRQPSTIPGPNMHRHLRYAMLALIVGSLVWSVIMTYKLNSLREDFKKYVLPVVKWGTTRDFSQSQRLEMNAIGHLFIEQATTHKMIGIAVHYDGLQDILDTGDLQKSKKYEIRDEIVTMMIKVSDDFMQAIRKGTRTTSYVLLLVPNDISEDFVTLRSAINLGAIVAWKGSGPP